MSKNDLNARLRTRFMRKVKTPITTLGRKSFWFILKMWSLLMTDADLMARGRFRREGVDRNDDRRLFYLCRYLKVSSIHRNNLLGLSLMSGTHPDRPQSFHPPSTSTKTNTQHIFWLVWFYLLHWILAVAAVQRWFIDLVVKSTKNPS